MSDNQKPLVLGKLDMIVILFLGETKRFHPALITYRPLPGQHSTPLADLTMVRYKSKSHHATGAATIEEARKLVVAMRKSVTLDDRQVFSDQALCVADPVITTVTSTWLQEAEPEHPLAGLGPLIRNADEVEVVAVSG